jgi:hypothetical protein
LASRQAILGPSITPTPSGAKPAGDSTSRSAAPMWHHDRFRATRGRRRRRLARRDLHAFRLNEVTQVPSFQSQVSPSTAAPMPESVHQPYTNPPQFPSTSRGTGRPGSGVGAAMAGASGAEFGQATARRFESRWAESTGLARRPRRYGMATWTGRYAPANAPPAKCSSLEHQSARGVRE